MHFFCIFFTLHIHHSFIFVIDMNMKTLLSEMHKVLFFLALYCILISLMFRNSGVSLAPTSNTSQKAI